VSRGPEKSLAGLDRAWSRRLTAPDGDGIDRSWHVLDNRAEPTTGTMLCVHGNPTWSYLWRRFLGAAPPGWRVVAVDQLGMGWSERVPEPRRLGRRIDDLDALTLALDIKGQVVTVAHDWGGPISVGWAIRHRDQLAGMVLANTAVNHDLTTAAPILIRLARARRLRDLICVRTPAFVRTAAALSRPALPREVRDALAAPYRSAAARRAVGDFVADIPLEPNHPSRAVLDCLAEGLTGLADIPALLLWGARDPVFTERYLGDLIDRLPQADVQRYPRAAHLVTEDVPEAAGHVWQWVGALAKESERPARPQEPIALPWTAQLARQGDVATAVTEFHRGRTRAITFAELERRISRVAAGLQVDGVRPGHRVALLVPPGIDLTVAVYACWRIGAVIVVADAGLGVGGLALALRSARPDHVLGIDRALAAVRLWRVPGCRVPVRRLREYAERDRAPEAHSPRLDDEAAVLFTSGATGPAKGVVYTLARLSAQIEAVRSTYRLTEADRLVAAFAPFALYGPALGVGAVVPDMTVTAPGTLTASALADAAAAVDATVVFASPAALRNVVATADRLSQAQRVCLERIRLVMSAGAPVPARLLRQVGRLLPNAALHTPYGMTEALPIADISLPEIEQAGQGNGVCVGQPRPGVEVRLSPLDRLGRAEGTLTDEPEVTGEICVAAAYVKLRYDRLWVTEQASARNPGWHRTGDVGHLDRTGRLWVEGRLVHVISPPDRPVTPVGLEQAIEANDEVAMAAVVGVGPVGTQQVVAVVVPSAGQQASGPLAQPALAAVVRAAAAPTTLAAVLTSRRLPTDIRHASKIDRAAVARWAGRALAGSRSGRL
jgi:acyl-coenzyme A synthetase/AMP-(fatty) acid ligase/pimeloyl-ACP methyl ester carboxylesterase